MVDAQSELARVVGRSTGMPLAYNTPYMKKVIVLMTDGNNEWYDWNCGVPGPDTAHVRLSMVHDAAERGSSSGRRSG